jgi:hypothetical protein
VASEVPVALQQAHGDILDQVRKHLVPVIVDGIAYEWAVVVGGKANQEAKIQMINYYLVSVRSVGCAGDVLAAQMPEAVRLLQEYAL